jgi:hypothetical protein
MRELKFDLDVQTNALLCPNPIDFYSKCYVTQNLVDNFRLVPGVKESTKLASNTFASVLTAAGCSWSATDSVLDAVDIDVCKFDAMVQICQYDLESSFVALQMAKGDSNWEVASFMNHYWSELEKEVNHELQHIMWVGDTSEATYTGATAYLKLCDGYQVKLAQALTGSTAPTQTTGVTITSANIISAMTDTVGALGECSKGQKEDVRIYMSANNAFLYQIATLGLNTNFNYTGELSLSFAGYKISVQPMMSDAFIVAGNKNNFVYAFDGEADSKGVKAVNMSDTTAEPIIRTRIGLKAGFHLLNTDEISYFEVV